MADSQYQTILEGVSTALKAAIGTSSSATHKIADAQFYVRKFPSQRGATFPAVLICPEKQTVTPATNASYDVGYGVAIHVVQASNQDLTTYQDRLEYWRQEIIDALSDVRLSGVSAVYVMRIEPGVVFDPPNFVNNFDATSLVVRAFVRKTNK